MAKPWLFEKLPNSFQKVYRFCVICGDERFSNEKWAKVIDIWGPPTICDKSSCWEALAYMSGFVPRKHYSIETELDHSRIKDAKHKEFFEEIDQVTTTTHNDRVFQSEEEMPLEYIETFKKLENFPAGIRISKIHSIYFDHKEKNKIEVGNYLTDTNDPFLKALAVYRQKSIKILQSLK